ncbi:MAG: DUF2474 family protein [Hyphomicrobiaceae bacterium]
MTAAWEPGGDEPRREEKVSLWYRLGWFVLLWLGSVLFLGVIAAVVRWLLPT